MGSMFFGNLMILKLKIIPARKNFSIFQGSLFSAFIVSLGGKLINLPCQTGGSANESLIILSEQFLIYAGSVIKTLQLPDCNQLHEILISGHILYQQHQVVITPFFPR